jgi:hypothetical protein
MADNREMHAMLFSALHLPPLPAVVDIVDRDDHRVKSDSAAESSHSIIATLIDYCSLAISKDCNGKRMAEQFRLLGEFNEDLQKLDLEGPIEPIYEFYCHHTRLWIATYPVPMSGGTRFKPPDYVVSGDKVHVAMQGYAKSQLYHLTDGKQTLNTAANVEYLDLLRKCAQWTLEAGLRGNEEYGAEEGDQT